MKITPQINPEAKAKTKITASLKLSPLMKQSIEILQMPLFELNDLLDKELINNPLLESNDSRLEDTEFFQEDYSCFSDGRIHSKEMQKKKDFLEGLLTKPVTLEEHLLRQLRILNLSQVQQKIGELIIGSIDDNGYLRFSIGEIAQLAKVQAGQAENILSLIQDFDPAGVAAREIKECLILQLKSKGCDDSLESKIIRDHFLDLEMKRFIKIARVLNTTVHRIKHAGEEIAKLEPRPGRNFGCNKAHSITPDIILQKVGDDYKIETNREGVLWLRVNPYYRVLLKNEKTLETTRRYLRAKLGSALWLIRAIEKRQKTIIKIVECIVDLQREFFEQGAIYLKPLQLTDVSRILGIHKSTVSRAISGKYIQTPQGTFKLRYFFDDAIKCNNQVHAQKSIKQIIKGLIDKNQDKNYLSDSKIAKMLRRRGIFIARRTVAKYRAQMRILPSYLRRK